MGHKDLDCLASFEKVEAVDLISRPLSSVAAN